MTLRPPIRASGHAPRSAPRACFGLCAALFVAACGRPERKAAHAPASPVETRNAAEAATEADDSAEATPGQEGDDPASAAPASVAASPPASGAGGAALLGEADRELAQKKSSTYAHHTQVDESTGTFDYDCSGFLVYALSRAAPDALAAVRATTTRRPRSVELVTFLEGISAGGTRGRWQRVARVQDLLPGDVIVWLKPPESHSSNTGHTLVVHGPVAADPAHPGAFIVPVVDSTARPHGEGDARATEQRTGLGLGEIVLVADRSGAPVRYRWSHAARSPEKATTIALGRLR